MGISVIQEQRDSKLFTTRDQTYMPTVLTSSVGIVNTIKNITRGDVSF
jgi:hypothetical protein